MLVTILGCGPAGLMAAHAAAEAGADINIVSKRRKSELFGAQYLHAPIPDITDGDPVRVEYRLEGDSFAYKQKVYGPLWDGSVSPDDLPGRHDAWDIRQTYDRLWDLYSHNIVDVNISGGLIAAWLNSKEVPLIISSIPRPALCMRGHTFGSQDIIAAGDAPGRGIRIPYNAPPNTVICNGNENPSWYRLSNIFDHHTAEWSMASLRTAPPVATAAVVKKPLFHNCDCLAEVIHVGRYGRWEKGVLSHEAFNDTYTAVERRLAGLPS